jgi:DNA polymerase (family 10)
MDNEVIADRLDEIAALLDIKGENPFKVRAYSTAARTIRSLEEEVETLVKQGRLHVRGIGESIKEKLDELLASGHIAYLDELKKALPQGLLDMLQVEGLGPKKVKALFEQLEVDTLAKLEQACKDGRVAELKGFGEKTQEKILASLDQLSKRKGRVLHAAALASAERVKKLLEKLPQSKRVEIAGSVRRGRETVKDIDILVASDEPAPVMEAVAKAGAELIGTGPTKTSIRLDDGLQVDVRVVPPVSFGAAWTYFTGSKEFNITLRMMALEKGLSLNEYALTPLAGGDLIPCPKEEDVFAKLGLPWIAPELRENTGEIPAALDGKLPGLIEQDDLKGVLHVHTSWSDGAHTVEQMVGEAVKWGFEFVGISDHTKAASYANGLDEERVARQREEIEAARAKFKNKIRVFHGVEADILPEGAVDLDEKTLASLDFVIASLHTAFTLPRDQQTKRIVRALKNPYVRVFGHPTARYILGREGAAFDWEEVLEVAKEKKVAIEVNGQPQRRDADWVHIRRIRAKGGMKVCLNPDAHGTGELDYVRWALVEARRGWCERDMVANALPADRFAREFLRIGS